jgi:hypothetical protein
MTPHADFIPFYNHPKADDELVGQLKKLPARTPESKSLRFFLCCAGPARTKTPARQQSATGSAPSRSPWILA